MTSTEKMEPLSWPRADVDPMAEQITQALHDGETQAKAAASLTRGIVELMVFLEDRLKLIFGNADSSVADLDAQHSSVPAATEQHLATPGVFHGVGKQVADHLLQQARIATDRKAARDHAQRQPFCLRVIGELVSHLVKQFVDGEIHRFGADDACLHLVYVEQRIQHARHGTQRVVNSCDQLLGALALDDLGQQSLEQCERLQWLAEIMARRGKKSRLGDARQIRLPLGHAQFIG